MPDSQPLAPTFYTQQWAEYGKFIAVPVSAVSSIGYPVNGTQSYAVLTYNIGTSDSGGGSGSTTPSVSAVVNQEIQTNATGTTFVTLTALAAREVTVFNTTGTTIEVRRGGAGVAIKLPDGASKTFDAITNANALSLRRTDTSNTQVTVQYEVRS